MEGLGVEDILKNDGCAEKLKRKMSDGLFQHLDKGVL